MLGLSHRETTAHIALREWFEIFFFLIRRAVGQEDFHVADVGRLAVEEIVSDRCASELFAHERKLRKREAETAVFARQERRPESERFNFLARCVQCWCEIAKRTAQEVRLDGVSIRKQEFLDPVEQSDEFLVVVIRHDDAHKRITVCG